jgi:nitronate monooxygenase
VTVRTPVCDLLGVAHPIVLAGMGGVARAELVAAVSNAGGFGFLGMVREKPSLIRDQIAEVRSLTTRPFGVNLIPAATPPELLEAELQVVLQEKVSAVTLFWDLNAPLVTRLKQAGVAVFCQVGTAAEAAAAAHAGADVLIAQGVEAGGHVRDVVPLATLLADIAARRLSPPVLAAGGLADGRDVAAAMRQGAQGAVLGTAFLATRESFAHDFHKQRIVAAKPGETLRTGIFHINWPPGAAVRVLPNSVTRGERGDPWSGARRLIGHEEGRPIYLFSTDSPQRNMTGDFEAMALYAGEGAGRLMTIPTAAERLAGIVAALS